MPAKELHFLSVDALSSLIATKKVSPVEVVRAHLERIDATEPTLNAFITRLDEEALASAQRAEREIQEGKNRGPLHGVPVGLKDLFYLKGVPNTSGSKIFQNFIPDYDSTVVSRLKEAGAIFMGKLNLHQFAFGPLGVNADYGDTRNPWDPSRLTGGSSGGSGAAASAGQCTITMGTDTGGSVRIPSALCGLVGIKPTYGRISRHGIAPLSWSLDHAGPMARTVEDCAIALSILAGHDPKDPSSSAKPVPDYRASLTTEIHGLRVGVPKEYFEAPIDPQVRAVTERAIGVLKELGAEIKEVSWPMYHQSGVVSTPIISAEAAALHRDLLIRRGREYDPIVRFRFEAGLFISSSDYLRALRARAVYNQQTADLFREVDLLAGPMEPVIAPPIGDREIVINGTPIDVMTALLQYSRPFNITGFPALTVPCGLVEGLPLGLQLVGRPFEEIAILNAGYAYQQATTWHQIRPDI